MSSIQPGPCDTGVILRTEVRPCKPRAGPWILAATILGSSMAFLDGTVVQIALPVIQEDLDASASGAQWVVEAYLLLLSSLVLVGGSLADRLGRRRVFMLGTAAFAASSAACGLAPGVAAMVAARAVQGAAAALLVPSSLAILGAAFPPNERGRAIGTWSALTGIAAAIGPALGGWMVSIVSWRAVFFLNLPLAAVILLIAGRKVPETRGPAEGPLDLAGAALATAGLGALTYGLVEASAAGWRAPRVWAPALSGAAALAAFPAVERRARTPMVPPALFRIRSFTAVNLVTFFLYAAIAVAFFFLPFELIQAREYSAAAAGMALLPLILVVSLLSPAAGRLADRIGAGLPLRIGPLVAGAGFLLLALMPARGGYAVSLLPALGILGLGMAITVAPLTATVFNSVRNEDAGTASGVNNAVARVAGLLAIAAFGIVAAASFNRALDGRLDAAAIPEATRRLLAPERSRLGAMRVPASVPESEAMDIRSAVRVSLDTSFRTVSLGCSVLAFFGAACAAWGVERRSAAAPAEDAAT
jgi:EmrB/QacA subfamily drug resistance transporter